MKFTQEDVARIAHEANRALCDALGDLSQQVWGVSPDWQKDSVHDGVAFVLANPHAGPAAAHDNWCDRKVAEGWTYGAEKDADNKIHPCLVPFARLPAEQQAKDHLFRGIVLALAPFVAAESSS